MAQLTDFVPMGSTCEINKLTLKNTSDKKKRLFGFLICRVLSVECHG